LKFCIIGNDKWFRGEETGGAEKQLALIANALSEGGHSVYFVVPGEAKSSHSKISIRSGWVEKKGSPGIRHFTYRMPNLLNILISIRADVYYTRGSSIFVPTVVKAASKIDSISLIGLAHIADLVFSKWKERHPNLSIFQYFLQYLKFQYFLQFGVKRAMYCAVQNLEQKQQLQTLGVQNIELLNIFQSTNVKGKFKTSNKKYDLIWVGSVNSRKGAHKLPELISLIPTLSICIIGEQTGAESKKIISKCLQYENVHYLGRLLNKNVLLNLDRTKIHINTADSEGFPNVFLEAWALGIPVVSLKANPNNLLSGNQSLGYCANGSIKKMASLINSIVNEEHLLKSFEERCRKYVKINHSSQKVIATLTGLSDFEKNA